MGQREAVPEQYAAAMRQGHREWVGCAPPRPAPPTASRASPSCCWRSAAPPAAHSPPAGRPAAGQASRAGEACQGAVGSNAPARRPTQPSAAETTARRGASAAIRAAPLTGVGATLSATDTALRRAMPPRTQGCCHSCSGVGLRGSSGAGVSAMSAHWPPLASTARCSRQLQPAATQTAAEPPKHQLRPSAPGVGIRIHHGPQQRHGIGRQPGRHLVLCCRNLAE